MSKMSRIPLPVLKQVAQVFKDNLALPHVELAGTQSPKHPGEPTESSDIDLVSFPLDFKRRRKYYMGICGRYLLRPPKYPKEVDGKWVDLGIFDPKDAARNQLTDAPWCKGHSVEYWRKFNVRLA